MFKSNREIPDELNRISIEEKRCKNIEERKVDDGKVDVPAGYEVHAVNCNQVFYRCRFIDN